MIMNPIIAPEAAPLGKAPSAATGTAKKPHDFKSFSDILSEGAGRGDPSPEGHPSGSESVASDAGAGADPAQEEIKADSGAEVGVASHEAPADAVFEAPGAEAGLIASETDTAIGASNTGSGLPGSGTLAASDGPGNLARSVNGAEADTEGRGAAVEKTSSGSTGQHLAEGELPAADPEAETVTGRQTTARGVGTEQDTYPRAEAGPRQDSAAAAGGQAAFASSETRQNGKAPAAVPPQGAAAAETPLAEGENAAGNQRPPNTRTEAPVRETQAADEARSGTARAPAGAEKASEPPIAQPRTVRNTAAEAAAPGSKGTTASQPAPGLPNAPDASPAAAGPLQAVSASLAAPKGTTQKPGVATASAAVTGEPAPEAEIAGTGRLAAAGIKASGNWAAAASAPPQTSLQAPLASAAILQPLLAGGMTGGKTEAELLAGSVESLSGALGLSGDVPGLTQLLAEASIGTSAAHRPETPRLIAAQLAEAFAAKGDQKVEVSLNPQELGHVKMRVTASETGITMVIHTERPETGDLMRRHIHELAEEFRRMGYEDVSFEFSGGQAGSGWSGEEADGGAPSGRTADAGSAAAADAQETATQNLRMGNSGVDMRV